MEDGGAARLRRVYREAGRSLILGFSLFFLLCGCFALLLYSLPQLKEAEKATFSDFPPKSLSSLSAQRDVLLTYARTYPASVLSGLCFMYILMQTFAIPGTLSLSLLAGALYGVLKGLLLVSVVSTLGSACCFLLSRYIGKGLAQAIWPEKVGSFAREVDKRRSDMLSYIIFLRVTPILPNTFINLASPIVRVPLAQFLAGTLVGCMPNNFVAVNAGNKLSELQSLKDLYNIRHLIVGLGIGIIALLPICMRHRSSAKKPA